MSCERVFEQHPDRPLLGRIRRGGFTGTCFSSPCVYLIKRKFEIKSNNSRSWWVFFFIYFQINKKKLYAHGLTDIKMRLKFGFINLIIYERLNPFLFFNVFITTEQVEYNPGNALNRERLQKKKKRKINKKAHTQYSISNISIESVGWRRQPRFMHLGFLKCSNI